MNGYLETTDDTTIRVLLQQRRRFVFVIVGILNLENIVVVAGIIL